MQQNRIGRCLYLLLCLMLIFVSLKDVRIWAAANPKILLDQADTLFQQKKYAEALERYEALLAQDPAFVDAYRSVLDCYSRLGDLQGALIFFESLFLDYPDRAEVNYGMGYALFNLQKYKEAANYFEQALKLDPKLAEAWNNRAAIYQFIEKDYAHARIFYQKAIELAEQTGNQRVLKIAGQNLAHIPREEVLTPFSEPLSLEQFINRFVAAVENQNHKAIQELVLGQKHNSELAMDWLIEEALRSAHQTQDEEQNSALLLARLLEKAYVKAFNDTSLKEKLDNFQRIDKGLLAQAEALLQEGLAFERDHAYSQALAHYQEALAGFKKLNMRRKVGITHVYIGDVYGKLQQYNQAQKDYGEALVYFEETEDSEYKARILASLGQACFNAEDYKSALEYMEQSLGMYRQLKRDDEVQKLEKNMEVVKTKLTN